MGTQARRILTSIGRCPAQRSPSERSQRAETSAIGEISPTASFARIVLAAQQLATTLSRAYARSESDTDGERSRQILPRERRFELPLQFVHGALVDPRAG